MHLLYTAEQGGVLTLSIGGLCRGTVSGCSHPGGGSLVSTFCTHCQRQCLLVLAVHLNLTPGRPRHSCGPEAFGVHDMSTIYTDSRLHPLATPQITSEQFIFLFFKKWENIGKDVEKSEHLDITSGNIKWYGKYARQLIYLVYCFQFCLCLSFSLFFVLWDGVSCSLVWLWTILPLNSWSSCVYLPGAGIISTCHHFFLVSPSF